MVLGRHRLEAAALMKPGIVNQDIDTAELVFGFLEDIGAGFPVGATGAEA